MEGPWHVPNMNSEPGKARRLAKGNPQEITHISDLTHVSDLTHISLTMVARLSEFACVTIHMLPFSC